jgi:hypothetical protein
MHFQIAKHEPILSAGTGSSAALPALFDARQDLV